MKNKYFTERERYYMEALLDYGHTPKEISVYLDKCLATIYNEMKRGMVTLMHSDLTFYKVYKADVAQCHAVYNATNKGPHLKIGNDYDFARYVTKKLLDDKYSPEAVLFDIHKNGLSFRTSVCKGTLYSYIKKGLFIGLSMDSLPMPRKSRKSAKLGRTVAYNNCLCKSIEDRPKDILNRDEYGHWEMDTVVPGKGKKGILLVFTERSAREEEIYKIPDKTALSVVNCLNRIEEKIGYASFVNRYKTITCDNGVEFLATSLIETSVNQVDKRTDLFYCHPYSSFERGSNENQNRLIRRWIPKGSDISKYSDAYICKIQDWINSYPRPMFCGLSSLEYKKLLI